MSIENNNKKSPAIIFDFGGVLMDWNPYYLYRHLLGDDPQETVRFLKAVDFSTWNVENDRGRTVADGTALLIERYPQYRDLIRAYDERFLETLSGAVQPTVNILRTLKDAGYPLYGLTNWPAEKFAQVRQIYPFFSWFDDIVVSGEVRLVKPEKPIYELLLSRIGHPAQECLFIDDHLPNIATARELGINTIHYQSPPQLEAQLRKMGILLLSVGVLAN